ncbi:MAG: FAD:protein FMN transferase [Deltaproteobacteria bacterium]|nr:FAD:protein FMN transferase [Deltaproteobacteria bacterium]
MSLLLPLLLTMSTTGPGVAAPVAPPVGAPAAVVAAPAAVAETPIPVADFQLVRKGRAFDDAVVDVLVMAGAADGDAHADAALDEVQRVVTLFDARRAEGPIARLHEQAGKEALVVDPEVFAVLTELQRIAKLSKGAFDVTAAAYDEAWVFSGDKADKDPPLKVDIDRLRQLVSVDDLVLDPVARTARLKKAGARVDLHAVIKGYALDRARAVLLGRGAVDFVLSSGGDVVVNGRKGERPWMVGVQDPRAPGPFLALPVDVTALGGAVMSSSDNEHFFLAAGVRYHSILDPRTGLPSTRSRSVTVLHNDALVAEALSRAVFVLGEKEGMKLIERLPGTNAVIVTADNHVVLSKGLQKLATAQALQQRPPTDGP